MTFLTENKIKKNRKENTDYSWIENLFQKYIKNNKTYIKIKPKRMVKKREVVDYE